MIRLGCDLPWFDIILRPGGRAAASTLPRRPAALQPTAVHHRRRRRGDGQDHPPDEGLVERSCVCRTLRPVLCRSMPLVQRAGGGMGRAAVLNWKTGEASRSRMLPPPRRQRRGGREGREMNFYQKINVGFATFRGTLAISTPI